MPVVGQFSMPIDTTNNGTVYKTDKVSSTGQELSDPDKFILR
jgi:hypothetical protein